jgi:hypothetical protein
MNSPLRYFVRINGEVRGPCDLERLRELVEIGLLTAQTDAAERAEGPWARLETWPIHAEVFASREKLALTDAKFETTPDAPEPVDLRDIIAYSNNLERVLRPSHPQDLTAHLAAKAAAAPNEVEAMVRDVQAREAQFAPPPPPPPKWKPSRRLVLVVSIAVAGNGLLAGIMTYYEGWNHNHSQVIATGIAVIFNGGILIFYHQLPKE